MSLDVGEVKRQLLLDGRNKEQILLGFGDVTDMHAEQAEFLTLRLLFESLVIIEESSGGLHDLILVDSPHILKVVDDCGLFIERFQDFFVSHVVKTQDTVADSRGFEDLDPADFGGVVAVSAAACLHVDSFDVDDSDLVTWHNTALVKIEAVLGLCLLLALEVFLDWMALKDDPVCFVFDLHFDLFCDGRVMSDVKMGIVFGLFCSVLPDVRTKHASCSRIDNVSSSVEGSEGVSAFDIDLSLNWLADD